MNLFLIHISDKNHCSLKMSEEMKLMIFLHYSIITDIEWMLSNHNDVFKVWWWQDMMMTTRCDVVCEVWRSRKCLSNGSKSTMISAGACPLNTISFTGFRILEYKVFAPSQPVSYGAVNALRFTLHPRSPPLMARLYAP